LESGCKKLSSKKMICPFPMLYPMNIYVAYINAI